jgi:hypothetical protein
MDEVLFSHHQIKIKKTPAHGDSLQVRRSLLLVLGVLRGVLPVVGSLGERFLMVKTRVFLLDFSQFRLHEQVVSGWWTRDLGGLFLLGLGASSYQRERE